MRQIETQGTQEVIRVAITPGPWRKYRDKNTQEIETISIRELKKRIQGE
jgi:hypothetical protein